MIVTREYKTTSFPVPDKSATDSFPQAPVDSLTNEIDYLRKRCVELELELVRLDRRRYYDPYPYPPYWNPGWASRWGRPVYGIEITCRGNKCR